MSKTITRNLVSRHDLVTVGTSDLAGRGIMAQRDIQESEVIERAVAVPIYERERWILEATSIWEYYFVARPELESPYVSGYVVFGISSICNHSRNPTADLEWIRQDDGVWVELKARHPLRGGDEITIHYQNIEEYVGYGKISAGDAYGAAAMSLVAR